ncbi:MAG TPA: hypothetical protein PKD72_11765 [Gemmatales bacterium]|nr:hypothetical protein [Gemmatales bacterium]
MRWITLTLAMGLVALSAGWADDKKSKIPPLTFVGNYEGEITHVDANSDTLSLKIRGVVPKWVPNWQNNQQLPPGALRNFQNQFNQGGGKYVPQEETHHVSINLSPDVKVRLMYGTPASRQKLPDADHEKSENATKKDSEAKDEKDKSVQASDDTDADDEKEMKKTPAKKAASTKSTSSKSKTPSAKEWAERDPDYKLGGNPGKKAMLAKGQIVRVAMGRNHDRVNPQIYGMVVYVIKEGK